MLSIICPTRGGDHLINWIEYHLNFFEVNLACEWELLLCGDFHNQKIPNLHSKIRIIYGTTFFEKNLKGLRSAQYDNILRIADDDYIVAFDENCISSINEDVIGVVPQTFFSTLDNWLNRLSDQNLRAANSSLAITDHPSADVRIVNYLTPPLPGDNSLFWGIYKKNALIESYEKFAFFYSRHFVASDWAFMANILAKGKIAKASNWRVIRHMTPFATTLSEKSSTLLSSQNELRILEAMPLLPSLVFIRDMIMNDPTKIWRSLVEWNLVRYSQLAKTKNFDEHTALDSLSIINIFQNSKWIENNGDYDLKICLG